MNKRNGVSVWLLCGLMAAGAGMAARAAAQAHPANKSLPVATTAPLTDQEAADTQEQLLKLLRMSPTLTTVVARDPSLLADENYVQRNNPELAQFLAAHPDVAQNPDFYLFSNLNPHGRRDQALERAVWPEIDGPGRDPSAPVLIVDKIVPLVGFACFFFAVVWIVRLSMETFRFNRAFRQQSEVHARLIDRFSSSQELAAYMETEAGKRFLEAAPVSMATGVGQHMPNVVARVLTPLQIGIVMALLGAGLLLLRNAGPDTQVPMLVLGTIALMPGVGFILSAGATWVLARRLGLLPEKASDTPAGSRERL
ncbi:MAG: hypothetical protein WBE72_13140 [Terracidiphilus sp.]